jgi:hypothetical protein
VLFARFFAGIPFICDKQGGFLAEGIDQKIKQVGLAPKVPSVNIGFTVALVSPFQS